MSMNPGETTNALGINHALGVNALQVSNGCDAVAANRDISGDPRISGPIDDVAILDEHIEIAATEQHFS